MTIKHLFLVCGLFVASLSYGQTKKDSLDNFTLADYDELFSELDALLDSLMQPRDFTLFNLGVGSGFFSYPSASGFTVENKRRMIYSPSVGYYDKSGFGIGVGTSLVNDGTGMNPYQFSVTGSYDYLQQKAFLTGISLTHFFTKQDLPFYTSPLQNEVYGYFTYRKNWFKPSVGLSYGWGSREAFEEREEKILNIQLAQKGYTRINTRESIIDLSLNTSIRHDFYFMDLLSKHDYVRLTPQITFVSGTQQFGFNRTSNTYATVRRSGSNILYNTENISLDNQLYFQPISLSGFLKTEYSIGKFFLQPQVIFDYYFPAQKDNFTTSWLINTGLIF